MPEQSKYKRVTMQTMEIENDQSLQQARTEKNSRTKTSKPIRKLVKNHQSKKNSQRRKTKQQRPIITIDQLIQLQINHDEKTEIRKQGLQRSEIRKIKKMKIGHSEKDCSVCFEQFERKEIIRELPCKHIFHNKCIKPWLKKSVKCPNCRFNMKKYFQEMQQDNQKQQKISLNEQMFKQSQTQQMNKRQ